MSETTLTPPEGATAAPKPAEAPPKPEQAALPLNDAFAALDKMVEVPAAVEPAESATPAEKPAEPTPSAKPAEKDGTKPTDTTSAEAKPVKAAELRAAYDAAKKRLSESDKRIAEFEKQIKALESKPRDDAKLAELNAKLEAAEKRRTELEDHLRLVDYRKSSEFVDKYEKPYTEAWAGALKEIAELTVSDAEGNTRPGNSQDLIALCNLPLGQAMAKAKEMFGELAPVVLAHRKSIRDLADAQAKAEGEAKNKSKEFFENREKQTRAQAEQMQAQFRTLNDEAVKKYPQWFGPAEGDEEGNKLLETGFKMADAAFSGQLKPEDAVRLHSAIRNKAAGFDRLVYRLNKAQGRIQELQKELDGFKKSEPGKGDAEGKPKKVEVSWEDQIDKLAK